MPGYFPIAAVRDAARSRWPAVLGQLGVNTALLQPRHGPCPGCGGRDRFRFDDREGDGTFICSGGGHGITAGGGLALLEHIHGWDWQRCVEEVGRLILPDSARTTASAGIPAGQPHWEGVAPEPQRRLEKRPPFDPAALRETVSGVPAITHDWLRARSPIPPHLVSPADYIEQVFDMGERALIFTHFYSQGDFLHEVGRGSYRLSQQPGVRAVASALPTGAPDGIWYLSNPVTGQWEPQPGNGGKKSRRSWPTVTAWRHAVLESDVAPEPDWLRLLVITKIPILAIYTSGGKSVHALVRIGADSKADWDTAGEKLRERLCPLGADGAAITAVRLTRLPGCMRGARKQELLYLNPAAQLGRSIL